MTQSCFRKTDYRALLLYLFFSIPSLVFSQTAVLTLVGPDTICGGFRDTLSIDFDGGTAPYIFYYSVNGVQQQPDTTNQDPYIFLTPILTKDTTIIRLDSVSLNGVPGAVSGIDTIIVLPFATATLLSDTVSLCAGQSDTLRIQFDGPGPYTFQYAVNTDTMPPITTSDSLYTIPIQLPPGQYVYKLTDVQGDTCGGLVQGIYSVLVLAPPTASLSGDTVICSGTQGFLTVSFTGSSPFVTNYTANGVPQKPDTSFFNPRTIIVTPDSTTLYQLTSVSSGGCTGTATSQSLVTVLPQPSATISGGGQICKGGNGTILTVTFNGTGPYTFVYSIRTGGQPPANQPPITTSSNPYILNVNPPNGTIYELVSVTNGVCSGAVSGIAVVAVFTPSTADLVGDITTCSAADTTILVDFTGSGPFELIYMANGVVQDTINTFDDPLLIPINITQTTVYELVSVESPGCLGTVNGVVTVTVNYPPTFDNVAQTCDLTAGTYTVEFDAIGATLPMTILTGSGNFSGTHFTSNPIPLGQNYSFIFHDVNDCGDIEVSGLSTCNCATNAGGMDLTPINACTGSPAMANSLGNASLDPEDALVFVLHTGSGTTLGTVLDSKKQPVFSFIPGTMTVGTTYYISAVAGDSTLTGLVNLNDPCLSVSPGTPIVWAESPTASMDANFDICPGGQVFIPVTFTGTPPFSFTYTSNGQSNTVTALQKTFSISATLLNSTSFQAVTVSNALCPGTASGQAIVTVHTAPQIVNVAVLCSADNLSYTVEFDVIKADSSSVSITGSVTGNFDKFSKRFTSDPIPVQTGFSAIVTDGWQCGLDSISGGANCACTTSAGVMDQGPQVLCNTDTAFSTLASGFFLAPGDTLIYALVDAPIPAAWTILAFSQDPVFAFNPANMSPGTPYHIVALAGNIIPTGLDLTDPCLSYSLGSTVTWQPQSTIVLGADTDICQGDTTALAVLLSGNPPFSFIYQVNGTDQPTLSTSNAQYLLSVSPAQTSIYSLFSGTANGCPADVSGSAVVTVNSVPQILNATTICDLNTFTYTLQFDVSNGPAPNPVYTVSGLQGSFTDSVFTSVPIPSGQPYDVVVTTPDNCFAQLSGSFMCACATDAGMLSVSGPLNVCIPDTLTVPPATNANLGTGDTLNYILYQNPASLPQGIISTSSSPAFTLQPGMQPGTTYYIAAMAGNAMPNGSVDLSDPCLTYSPGVPVVFRQPPTATLNGDTTICIGSNTTFKINFTGTAPFQFVYTINGNSQSAVSAPQNTFTVSTSNVQQNQLFTLVSVQDAYCAGTAMGTFSVTSQPLPTAALASNTSICSGDSATLRLQLSGASLYDVTISGGPTPIQLTGVQNGSNFTVAPTSTTTYTITAFNAQGNNCPASIGASATVTVGPPLTATATVSDFGGFNLSCPNADDGSIVLTPQGGTPPLTAVWNTGQNGLNIQNLPAGSYAVNLTDALGCAFTDTFDLIAPESLVLVAAGTAPLCFGDRNGTIVIQSLQGGVGPFAISLNGMPNQTTDQFPAVLGGLPGGSYQLVIEDINGCEVIEDFTLTEPSPLTVTLGPDATIFPGDSVLLEAVVSGNVYSSFTWSPLIGLQTPDALQTFAKPFQTTVYKILVQDTFGCIAEAMIRITVNKTYRVYAPTAFKPELSGENGRFTLYAGPEVLQIKTMRVYDRWGETVFEGLGLTPNDPAQGWDGQYGGNFVQPGVYVWVAELEYQDGTSEVMGGDVTVVR